MIISIDNKWKSEGKNNLREGYESYNKDRHVLEKIKYGKMDQNGMSSLITTWHEAVSSKINT